MDGDADEPPKLAPKKGDASHVSKRLSYLMQMEKIQNLAPIPLPRFRKKSMELSNKSSTVLPSSSSSLSNINIVGSVEEIKKSNAMASNVNEKKGQPFADEATPFPTPSAKPQPKPRTRLNSRTAMEKDQSISENKDTGTISNVSGDGKELTSMIKDVTPILPISSTTVLDISNPLPTDSFDTFENSNTDLIKSNFSTTYGVSDVVNDKGGERESYLFPDCSFQNMPTDISTVPSKLIINTEETSNVIIDNGVMLRLRTPKPDPESTSLNIAEPATPKPFNLKPFKKHIQFEKETSFMETGMSYQPGSHTSVRLSDFDPLKNSTDQISDIIQTNSPLFLTTDMPASLQGLSEGPKVTSPGAYISLQQAETQQGINSDNSVNSKIQGHDQATASLKHVSSFHFAPPKGPPPPLPKVPTTTNKNKPPPIPPRLRPEDLVSVRSSPSSSTGPVRSSPIPNSNLDQQPQTPAITSAYLDNLPTPVFTPFGGEADPFSDTGFREFCHSFNSSLTLQQRAKIDCDPLMQPVLKQPDPPHDSITCSENSSTTAGWMNTHFITSQIHGSVDIAASDQNFEVDFEGAFGSQNTTVTDFVPSSGYPVLMEDDVCLDPKDSSYIDPSAPCSLARDNEGCPDTNDIYYLAQGMFLLLLIPSFI